MTNLNELALTIAHKWAAEPFDPDTRAEVQKLIDNNEQTEIINRFADKLHFGTAGLRGIMAAGPARMNRYTIAKASRALALCLTNEYQNANAPQKGVVIGYDCRKNSDIFAEITARVLTAAGIKVYLYNELTPTPLVPYAVRRLNAFAGVMVTSSHNPKKYNGYKVFWTNGAQIVEPVDKEIAAHMDKCDETNVPMMQLDDAKKQGLLIILDQKDINHYVDWVVQTSTFTKNTDVDVVYTPLGGTGWKIAKACFDKAGFKNIHVVEEEKNPGPDFAGLDAPNPERLDTWPRSIKLAKKQNAEIVLANDGDGDRLGVAIPQQNGEYRILNGNEIGALILYYILQNLPEEQKNKNTFALCSVVSSPLTKAICDHENIDFQETLTGFKWMGNVAEEKVKNGQKFIFAYEEAFGFTFGDSRDKDGITAVVLLAELAAWCKTENLKVQDILKEIHTKCNLHLESAAEKIYEGVQGKQIMTQLLAKLRENPPAEIADTKLASLRDLLNSKTTTYPDKNTTLVTHLPKQDMLTFKLDDNSWISIRPSGTEPKIKAYIGVINNTTADSYTEDIKLAQQKIEKLTDAVKKML